MSARKSLKPSGESKMFPNDGHAKVAAFIVLTSSKNRVYFVI